MSGGGYLWSAKDEQYLEELQLRASKQYPGKNGFLGLTPTQIKEDHLGQYEAKKQAWKEAEAKGIPNYQLGETAKSWIRKEWIEDNFGYYDEVYTPQILKGRLSEQDSLGLLDEINPIGEWRKINEDKFEDDDFTGRPDIIPRNKPIVEDVKTSWTIDTFAAVTTFPNLYNGQGQVYMELLDRDIFYLHYCLVSTPEVLLKKLKRQLWYMFKEDASEWRLTGLTEYKEGVSPEENPEYIAALEQLAVNHNYDDIDPTQRIKTFVINRDRDYIKELRIRVKSGRYYYDNLRLNAID
jgi:hypothetical protein